jgi:two-component system response regulator AtoC
MPGTDGIGFLAALKTRGIQMTVIVMSAYGSNDTAITAMKSGAYDYINKPFQAEELILTLRKAEEREQLRRENLELKSRVGRQAPGMQIIAKSEGMKRVIATATRIAAYRSTVLLTGESGTGKEVMARLIHETSTRARLPFVAVNCGAIPEGLMESEFFGHVKGAFTDAYGNKRGLIESAHGGTLFLDEVGELPLMLQVKMLRFLQEGEIRRVGDTRSQKVDARVVAATARDLIADVATGRFREDLFYRLNVVPIRIPPLRERPEDIPELADAFLKRTCDRMGIARPMSFHADAMRALIAYRWPGNVRELENAVERALVTSKGRVLTEEDFAFLRPASEAAPGWSVPTHLPLSDVEKAVIAATLRRNDGNVKETALVLGIDRSTLYDKLKRYGIERP